MGVAMVYQMCTQSREWVPVTRYPDHPLHRSSAVNYVSILV